MYIRLTKEHPMRKSFAICARSVRVFPKYIGDAFTARQRFSPNDIETASAGFLESRSGNTGVELVSPSCQASKQRIRWWHELEGNRVACQAEEKLDDVGERNTVGGKEMMDHGHCQHLVECTGCAIQERRQLTIQPAAAGRW